MTTMNPSAPERKPHILIADDDPLATRLLGSFLSDQYLVTTTADGREALDRLEQAQVDLILSDINMPEMNGYQLLTAVRAHPDYKDIPVILISGLAETSDIVRGLEMGANDYLTKPLDREIALARIRTQLTLKHLLDSQKRDINELKNAQLMRERFFHIASHDLKNPMNNIRMAHFLLRGMLEEDPSADILLSNIEIALENMQNIVNDFLDMAVIQSQALDLKLTDVLVEDVLWDVIIQFNVSAQKKDIVLKLDQVSGHVYADFRRLAQALSNLVSNAIKYSPRGSVVTLATETHGDRVRILIRDQGPGIPEHERSLLFQEFGKLSTKPTEGEGRTGLGLWIVKQLTTLQHGTVGADFPPEGGSLFWVELPTTAAKNSAPLPCIPITSTASGQD
jgi:signal transduction histidine kinase